METYVAFVATALALAGSPGPNTLSLAGVGAAFGWRRGIGYMVGLNLGMGVVLIAVGSGVAGLLFAVPGAAPVVTVLAAVYFAYLAFRIATAPPLSAGPDARRPPSWPVAVLASLANPKAYAAMAAMYSGFVLVADDGLADLAVKTATLLVIVVAVNVLWLVAGSALTPVFRDAKWSRVVNVGFAAALLIAVAASVLL